MDTNERKEKKTEDSFGAVDSLIRESVERLNLSPPFTSISENRCATWRSLFL